MRISKSTKTSVKASKKVCASQDRKVVYDKDGIKVATTGRDYDFIATIENDTDDEYCVEDLGLCVPAHDWVGLLADDEGYADLEYFKSLGGVKASKKLSANSTSDYKQCLKDALVARGGYRKSDVADQSTATLESWAKDAGIDIDNVCACGDIKSSTSTDKALQHIKAAIDILGTSGDKSDITKDSIANLSVVMFDLKSKN